ncbi:MAG: proton-conducting transporter membrane subunit [Syntrophobacteraceae bacterium]
MKPIILTILPLLIGSLLAVPAGWSRRNLAYPIGAASLSASAIAAVLLFFETLSQGTIHYQLGGWMPPWGIAFVVDSFSAAMVLLIAVSALITYLACREEITGHFPEKSAAFISLALLTVAGHMGIVSTGDMFNLYVLIEVAALSGYALLATGGGRSALTSLNYLCIGSVGASLYLLGVGYLYILTGSLNMADITGILAGFPASASLSAAIAILVLGIWVKMGLFPFHGWLPGAYGHSRSVAATLLAPLTTKVMIYVLVRLRLGVLPPEISFPAGIEQVAILLATTAIFAGSVMAFIQKDQMRMLCYILVAEVGYMAGGIFLGNRTAMTGALLHIFADALMTLTLFLALTNIARRRETMNLGSFGELFRHMPVTMAAFTLGALSMIGVPPLCGFFSKWYLLSGALEAGQYPFMAALIASSLMNLILFFRIFEAAFFEKWTGNPAAARESGRPRLALLGTAAGLLVVTGLSTGLIVERVISKIIPVNFG